MAKKLSYKRGLLKKVGLWATIWWAVSCLYGLLLVWQAKNLYVEEALPWPQALSRSFVVYQYLWSLLLVIIIGWAVCAYYWLKALKRAKISLKVGLKDLFLTLR